MEENRIREFAVSVARTIGRDPVTGEAIFYGTTNATTAVNLSASATDIRGGIANPIIYRWIHDKVMTVSINKPTFEKDFLALNIGSQILNNEVKVVQTDCMTLDDTGAGTLESVPIGVISVFLPNGTVLPLTAQVDKKILIPSAKGQKVNCIYDTLKTVDVLSIGAQTPPKVIDLTLIIDKRDQRGLLIELLHVHIPKFQIDGNFELSLAADGVSQETLTGTALTIDGVKCEDGDTFGYFVWENVLPNVMMSVADIATVPSVLNVVADAAKDQTTQLSVLGLRGHNLGTVDVTDLCTYAVATTPTPDAGITVSTTGLVTITQSVVAGASANIDVTYTNDGSVYEDSVAITVK